MSAPIPIHRTSRSYSVTDSYHSTPGSDFSSCARSTPSPTSHPFIVSFSENRYNKVWLTERLPGLDNQIYRHDLDVCHITAIYDIYVASKVPGASLPKELKSTFLFAGLLAQREDIVTGALTSGADINACDRLNRTPMHIVADRGFIALIPLLLPFNPNMNAQIQEENSPLDGMTPVHLATDNGYREIAEKLLEAGASRDAIDSKGRTPFLLTIDGCEDMFEFFLKGPLNLLAADADGNTSLHLSQNIATLKKLVQRANELGVLEAYLNAQNHLGETALISAVKPGVYGSQFSEKKVGFLIHAGAAIDVHDEKLRTALHWASINGNQPVLDLLIKARATIDLGDQELMTPLHLSICGVAPLCTESLLKAGSDKDSVDFNRNSALAMVSLFIQSLNCYMYTKNTSDNFDEDDFPVSGIFIEPLFGYEVMVHGSVEETLFILSKIQIHLVAAGAKEIYNPKEKILSPPTSPPVLDGSRVLAGSQSPIRFLTEQTSEGILPTLFIWTKV